MRTVNRSALVPYSAAAMFQLVCDVEAYPEFLPWCASSTLQSKSDSDLTAALQIGYGSINSAFTTANEFVEPEWMTMRLVDGPFSSLEGRWDFTSLGDDGCEVILKVEFAFANPLKDMLFGAAFETICNELIDAFIKRAQQKYD